jgi:hypothetical protein
MFIFGSLLVAFKVCSRSLGSLAWLWPEILPGQAKSHARPNFWLGFGLGSKAKKPWLFGLTPKSEHH